MQESKQSGALLEALDHMVWCALCTLWLSIRLRTRSMSPCTGWSSASWGSTLYSQSMRAWRASVNWPENKRASSSLFCLQESKYHWWGMQKHRKQKHCIAQMYSYLSTDLPQTVSHLSLSSLNMSSNFWLSSRRVVLSFKARPVRAVVSYTECLLPRTLWNSCQWDHQRAHPT